MVCISIFIANGQYNYIYYIETLQEVINEILLHSFITLLNEKYNTICVVYLAVILIR